MGSPLERLLYGPRESELQEPGQVDLADIVLRNPRGTQYLDQLQRERRAAQREEQNRLEAIEAEAVQTPGLRDLQAFSAGITSAVTGAGAALAQPISLLIGGERAPAFRGGIRRLQQAHKDYGALFRFLTQGSAGVTEAEDVSFAGGLVQFNTKDPLGLKIASAVNHAVLPFYGPEQAVRWAGGLVSAARAARPIVAAFAGSSYGRRMARLAANSGAVFGLSTIADEDLLLSPTTDFQESPAFSRRLLETGINTAFGAVLGPALHNIISLPLVGAKAASRGALAGLEAAARAARRAAPGVPLPVGSPAEPSAASVAGVREAVEARGASGVVQQLTGDLRAHRELQSLGLSEGEATGLLSNQLAARDVAASKTVPRPSGEAPPPEVIPTMLGGAGEAPPFRPSEATELLASRITAVLERSRGRMTKPIEHLYDLNTHAALSIANGVGPAELGFARGLANWEQAAAAINEAHPGRFLFRTVNRSVRAGKKSVTPMYDLLMAPKDAPRAQRMLNQAELELKRFGIFRGQPTTLSDGSTGIIERIFGRDNKVEVLRADGNRQRVKMDDLLPDWGPVGKADITEASNAFRDFVPEWGAAVEQGSSWDAFKAVFMQRFPEANRAFIGRYIDEQMRTYLKEQLPDAFLQFKKPLAEAAEASLYDLALSRGYHLVKPILPSGSTVGFGVVEALGAVAIGYDDDSKFIQSLLGALAGGLMGKWATRGIHPSKALYDVWGMLRSGAEKHGLAARNLEEYPIDVLIDFLETAKRAGATKTEEQIRAIIDQKLGIPKDLKPTEFVPREPLATDLQMEQMRSPRTGEPIWSYIEDPTDIDSLVEEAIAVVMEPVLGFRADQAATYFRTIHAEMLGPIKRKLLDMAGAGEAMPSMLARRILEELTPSGRSPYELGAAGLIGAGGDDEEGSFVSAALGAGALAAGAVAVLPRVGPQFFSRLQRHITRQAVDRAPVRAWLKAFEKGGDFSKEEFDTVLKPILQGMNSEERISRDQIMQMAQERQIVVRETVLGENAARDPSSLRELRLQSLAYRENAATNRLMQAEHDVFSAMGAIRTGYTGGWDRNWPIMQRNRETRTWKWLSKVLDRLPTEDEFQAVWKPMEAWQKARAYRQTLSSAYYRLSQQDSGDARGVLSAKFESFNEPGGTNYRNLIVSQVDEGYEELVRDRDALDKELQKLRKSKIPDLMNNPRYQEITDQMEAIRDSIADIADSLYHDGHFTGIPGRKLSYNDLVFALLHDRQTVDGKKILFIDQLQSDLHQLGKKSGYIGSKPPEQLSVGYKVPNLPFKENAWVEVGLKSVLARAVSGGYDGIAWQTGDIVRQYTGGQEAGQKQFYDEVIGNVLKKYANRMGYDLKVEALDIPGRAVLSGSPGIERTVLGMAVPRQGALLTEQTKGRILSEGQPLMAAAPFALAAQQGSPGENSDDDKGLFRALVGGAAAAGAVIALPRLTRYLLRDMLGGRVVAVGAERNAREFLQNVSRGARDLTGETSPFPGTSMPSVLPQSGPPIVELTPKGNLPAEYRRNLQRAAGGINQVGSLMARGAHLLVTPMPHWAQAMQRLVPELPFERLYNAVQDTQTKMFRFLAPYKKELIEIAKAFPSRAEREGLTDYLETGGAITGYLDSAGKLKPYNKTQLAAAKRLEDWYVRLGTGLGVDMIRFFRRYAPHIKLNNQLGMIDSLDDPLLWVGGKLPKAAEFFADFQRSGGDIFERDAMEAAQHYARAGAFNRIVKPRFDEAAAITNAVASKNRQLAAPLNLYLESVRGTPPRLDKVANAFVQDAFRLAGVRVSDRVFENFVHQMLGLSYASIIGVRPGLVIRNLAQVVFTSWPNHDVVDIIAGIEFAMSGGRKLAARDGAILDHLAGIPMGDLINANAGAQPAINMMSEIARRTPTLKAALSPSNVVQKSLWAYSSVDDVTRAMEYGSSLNRMLRAWAKHGDAVAKGAETSIEKPYGAKFKFDTPEEAFLADSGLRQFTREQQKRFYEILSLKGKEGATRWYAANASQERLFRYGQANQVGLFRGTTGRLYGQFGIWPQWYLMYVTSNMARGTGADKVKFLIKLGLTYLGVYKAAQAAGLDPEPWLAYPSRFGAPSPGPLAGVVLDGFDYLLETLRRRDAKAAIDLARLRKSWSLVVPNYSFFSRDVPAALEAIESDRPDAAQDALLRILSLKPDR